MPAPSKCRPIPEAKLYKPSHGGRSVAQSEVTRILIATDHKSWHQAIYVNGKLKTSDSSLYASEVADYVTPGELVMIESIDIDLVDNSFPDDASELVLASEE